MMHLEESVFEKQAGANVPTNFDDPKDDFAFLDGIDEDNCYMPIDTQRPSKSYDFGQDGSTGSVTTWHELLQLTAPDRKHGVVFVRGDFPDSPNSILARAQRRNPRGTFGLGVYVDDVTAPPAADRVAAVAQDWRPTVLEQTSAHGMVNMRWPCTRLNYVQNDDRGQPDIVADYTACSFVKDARLYQIVRISPRTPVDAPSPTESIGSSSENSGLKPRAIIDVKINIGGLLRFGCARQLGPDDTPRWPLLDTYSEGVPPPGHDGEACYVLACKSSRCSRKLEMKLWVNRKAIDMRQVRCPECGVCGPSTDIAARNMNRLRRVPDDGFDPDGYKHDVFYLQAVLPYKISREAINIVATFSLVEDGKSTDFFTKEEMISNKEVQDYLGYASYSTDAPYRLWSYIKNQAPGIEALDLNATGRCVEAILGVSAVPVPDRLPVATPTADKSASSPGDPRSRSSTQGPVLTGRRRIALVKNIMAAQVVDFESMFWQTRFLVKVLKCLDRRRLPSPLKIKNTLGSDPSSEASPTTTEFDDRNVRNVLMFKEYKDRLSQVLEGILCWILDIIPLMARTTSIDLALGTLPSDVNNDVDLAPPDVAEMAAATLLSGDSALRSRSLSVNRERRPEIEREKQKMRMRSQRWYCAMMIWYLWLNLPDGCDHKKGMKEGLWRVVECFVSMEESNKFRNQDNRTDTAILDDAYGCILRWYHSFSVWKLCQWLREDDQVRFDQLTIDMDTHIRLSDHWQAKAEKALRLFGQGRFLRQTLDHEVAYMAFVGKELEVDQGPRIQLGVTHTCLEYVTKLIHDRPESTTLYPGASRVTRWDAADVRSAVKRPAPWELSCLGHHVPLCLGIEEENEDGILEDCWHFLLSDSLFLGSVDPTKTNAAGLWWDLTTSSIVCTQLLVATDFGLTRRESWGGRDGLPGTVEPQDSRSNLPSAKSVRFKGPLFHEPRTGSPSPKKKTELIQVARERMSPIFVPKAQEEEKKKRFAEGLTWDRRLPLLLFHPDTAILSLGNTPDLFDLNQAKNVFLWPQIRKNFEVKWKGKTRWTLKNIHKYLTSMALRHISCVDLSLGVDVNGRPELVISQRRGRIQLVDRDLWEDTIESQVKDRPSAAAGQRRMAELTIEEINKSPGLVDLYFAGKHRKHPGYLTFPEEVKRTLDNDDVRSLLLKKYQSSLLSVLNDSLVDLGTRYRIIFARDLTPDTMRAMVYMWHPDALDAFDSHLGQLSQFSDSTQQVPRGGEDLWVTSITLSHWRLEDRTETKIRHVLEDLEKSPAAASSVAGSSFGLLGLKDMFQRWWSVLSKFVHGGPRPSRDMDGDTDDTLSRPRTSRWKQKKSTEKRESSSTAIDFPPPTVPDARKFTKRPYRIRELSVSLCITGDWGRYWTCTLVSELISASMAELYARETQDIMQMFINQPYTGRVLVFLLLLSHLAESLAAECEKFLDELDAVMEMDAMVLLRGIPWSKSDVALKKLKRMLWGLEALRIFSDKLARAINEIARAKAKIDTWVLVGHDLRHRDMERERQRVFEEFEKRHDRLESAHGNIKQRIEQGGRLREGISSVIGVEQNENISMLTWVTIAYLPLAFVAGLFSMDHGIVPLDLGWRAYGWLTAVFLCGTVLFALTLQYWITTFRHMSDGVQNSVLKPIWVGRGQDGDNDGTEKTTMIFPLRPSGGTPEAGILASGTAGKLEVFKTRFSHVLRRRGGHDLAGRGIDEEAGDAGGETLSHIHYAA